MVKKLKDVKNHLHLENTIKTITRCHSILVRMAKIKKKNKSIIDLSKQMKESAKTEGINCIKNKIDYDK